MSMKVVRYDPDAHHDAVVSLLAGMAGQAYPGALAGSTPAEVSLWLVSVPMVYRFVAVVDEVVVGHVALSPGGANGLLAGLSPEAWEVTRLFVASSGRGAGVGSALLEHAVAVGTALGGGLLLLVGADLLAAREFYRRRGWVTVAEKISARTGNTLLVLRPGT